MLGDIFYFIGFLLIFSMIFKIINFSRIVEVSDWINKFNKVTGKKPEIKDFRSSEEWKMIGSIGILSIFESFWTLIGLLSSNWMIFALLLIMGILTNIINKSNYMIFKKITMFTFLTTKTTLMILLVLNHFHNFNLITELWILISF
jgi:hypothetical protein